MPAVAMLHETLLDPLFRATAEGTEQAILNCLWRAETLVGRDGHCLQGIREFLEVHRGS
jgi:D-aminopeptidase